MLTLLIRTDSFHPLYEAIVCDRILQPCETSTHVSISLPLICIELLIPPVLKTAMMELEKCTICFWETKYGYGDTLREESLVDSSHSWNTSCIVVV